MMTPEQQRTSFVESNARTQQLVGQPRRSPTTWRLPTSSATKRSRPNWLRRSRPLESNSVDDHRISSSADQLGAAAPTETRSLGAEVLRCHQNRQQECGEAEGTLSTLLLHQDGASLRLSTPTHQQCRNTAAAHRTAGFGASDVFPASTGPTCSATSPPTSPPTGSSPWSYAVEFVATTPPTPDSAGILLDTKRRSSVGASPPLRLSGRLSTPTGSTSTALARVLRRCRLSRAMQQSILKRGWIAEQLLLSSLTSIADTLEAIEFTCTELEWIELSDLRDVYIRICVAHLEACMLLHNFDLPPPPAASALESQFVKIGQEIQARDCSRQQVPGTLESHHGMVSSVGRDASTAAPPKSSPSSGEIVLFQASSCHSFSDPSNLKGSGLEKCHSLEYNDGKIVTQNSTPSYDNSCDTAKAVGVDLNTSLKPLCMDLLKRETLKRMKVLLQQPVPLAILGKDELLEGSKAEHLRFSSPVKRRAQKRLGAIWSLMEQHGIGPTFQRLVQSDPFVGSVENHPRRSKVTDAKPSSRRAPNTKVAKPIGAMHLMGARVAIKGKYSSRRAQVNKAKRTRLKNLSRATAREDPNFDTNSPHISFSAAIKEVSPSQASPVAADGAPTISSNIHGSPYTVTAPRQVL